MTGVQTCALPIVHGLSKQAIAVQSPEDAMMEDQKQQERQELRRMLMKGLDSCLTPTQRPVLRGRADCPADRRG